MAGTDTRVVVLRRPLWRLRLGAALTRWVFYGLAGVGLIATARYTVLPPGSPRPAARPPAPPDSAEEVFATLFARRYLTWDAADPTLHQQQLAGFAGGELDPDAGFQPPASGAQTVQWADVVQERPGPEGDRIYTVGAETDHSGLVYLDVDVARDSERRLRLHGYPAIVGPPLVGPATADPDQGQTDVSQRPLAAVVQRALRNYLAGSVFNLAADLTTGARVSSPSQPLRLRDLTSLKWAPGGRSVLATLVADAGDGAQFTLRYELDVVPVGSRWEVAAIQTDPTA